MLKVAICVLNKWYPFHILYIILSCRCFIHEILRNGAKHSNIYIYSIYFSHSLKISNFLYILPSSRVESSLFTLLWSLSMRPWRWRDRLVNVSTSCVSSVNMSSACLLRLLSWRMMLLSVWLVTHSNSFAMPFSIPTRLTLMGSTQRCMNGMVYLSAKWNRDTCNITHHHYPNKLINQTKVYLHMLQHLIYNDKKSLILS